MIRIRLMFELASGHRTAQPLMKQQKQNRGALPFLSQPIAILPAVPFQEAVPPKLPEIITQTVEDVLFSSEAKTIQHRPVDLRTAPAADRGPGVQQHFQQTPHALILDSDTWNPSRPLLHRQRDPSQEGKFFVHIQVLGLLAGEAVQDRVKLLLRLQQISQAFLELEILQIIRGDFIAQEGLAFFVLLHPGMFPIRPENMPPLLHLFHHRLQLAPDAITVSAPKEAPDSLAADAP